MLCRYRVRIPIETITLATAQSSTSYGLSDGLELEDVLHIHVDNTEITYVVCDIVAQNRESAIAEAVSIARRCLQLIALLHDMGFELSLAGILVETLEVLEQQVEQWDEDGAHHIALHEHLEASDHIDIRASLNTFELLADAWKASLPNAELGDAVALALEWIYLGKIARDERNAFLAYWIALELLLDSPDKVRNRESDGMGSNAKVASTVVNDEVTLKSNRQRLKAELDAVFGGYIKDERKRNRVVAYALSAKAESDIERWARLLQEAGISVSRDEVRELRNARGSVVHSGGGGLPTARIREIATTYLKSVMGLTVP